jgi:antitoxin component YwqK of YwqJK toxin-antitoxin module
MQNEITELRNQVRTLKRIVYGFGCLLVAGIVVGATSLQTVPDVIQAKKFEVVNDEGRVFVLISGSTTQPNSIKSHQEGGIISTYNSQGETLILMGMNNHGSGAIQTKNKKGHTLVSLATTADGKGMVLTENGKGGTLVTLGANKSQGGLITSYSGKGVALAAFGASPDGNGVAVTYDKEGKGITSITPAPKTSSSLLSGCGSVEETICIETEGQERNGLVYLPNQEEPFTGKNLCKYENGQKKVEGSYKDGKEDGKWTWWYENGQIQSEANWKDGKIDEWTRWNENGIPVW